MKQLILILTSIVLLQHPAWAEDHHAHEQESTPHEEHGGHEEHEEGQPIILSPTQVKHAGIQTQIIKPQQSRQSIVAPGTVSANNYKLADVTTLVDAVVEKRYVRLGDKVKAGQRLVALSSSALAQAQADYLRAEGLYQTAKLDVERLEGLVKDKIVSQARFQQAQSNLQSAKAELAAARAALSAYGMRNKDIQKLPEAKNYGQLILRAPASGTVIADDFRLGQHIAAGSRLLQIVDESTVWVEVKLAQHQAAGIHIGDKAMVMLKSSPGAYAAKVINIDHRLDSVTRTVGVRLQAQNPEDRLHPGMFVTTEIETGHGKASLLIPEEAVQRQGSELIVFIEEEPGHFERREVEVGKASFGLVPVLRGIKSGESVVVKGAFTLASELAKSGFEVHNH